MTGEEHAADEAGGEVVFSSDGLPPLPKPIVKKSSASEAAAEEATGMAILDSGAKTTMAEAFEVFSGKIYPVVVPSGLARGSSVGKETLAERLARLQQEVSELESDLTMPNKSNESNSGADFLELVGGLKSRLQAQAGFVATTKTQSELTRKIHEHMEKFQETKISTPADQADNGAGVVYELYGGVGIPQAQKSESSLEERLLRLESLVGGSLQSSAANQSLLARLEEMETFLDRLNPKALDQASAKAKVIRSDLEAASKARSKLASAATFRKDDAKTISDLYEQMVQLEGISDHLPALVTRLQQLASLHTQSSSFAMRLTQSEREVVQIQNLVKHLEDSLTRVESGLTSNAQTIEANLQQLDERMKNL